MLELRKFSWVLSYFLFVHFLNAFGRVFLPAKKVFRGNLSFSADIESVFRLAASDDDDLLC